MRNRIVASMLLLLCAVCAWAKVYRVEDVPMVHLSDRTRYVSNPDNILSPAVVATMDSLLFSLEESTGIQVLVVAVTGIEGGDCFDFAYRLGQENGVGQEKRDNGLVILLSTDERCVQFATGYGLEGVMPDAICKRIQQKYMVEHLSADDWNRGMLEGVRAVCGLLDGSMENIDDEEDETTAILVFLAILFGGTFLAFWLAWYYNRCPRCKKRNIQRVDSRIVKRCNGYVVRETTYECKDCGYRFTRRTNSDDPSCRSRGGGAIIIGGGFGGYGGGNFGGSFGGGSFGGGGAGSRF